MYTFYFSVKNSIKHFKNLNLQIKIERSIYSFKKILLIKLYKLLKMRQIKSKEEYQTYVNKKTPNSPILKNCFNAFWVGGLICAIGQIIFEICKTRGIDETNSYIIVSMLLIFLSAFLTGLNIFNKIGKFAGAGSLVPITGFANSIVSPAMEYKSEGYVMGVGAKMFTVAGPVLVYGISSSILIGLIYIIFNTQNLILV